MTCAVSAAVREGAEAVICASTGNTAASAAAYAARAGLRGAVIVPEGKIATGKLAQALMHGARVIALRGNFDDALRARARARQPPPDRARQLGQRVPDRGPEDRLVRAGRGARRRARRALHPGRQRRQHHRLLEGVQGGRAAGRGCSASRPPARRRSSTGARSTNPETVASAIRIGNPARWEEAMDAMTLLGRGRQARSPTSRSSTPTGSSPRARACSASRPRRPASPGCWRTGPAARGGVVCVLTGHGLKDPQTALEQAGAVVPCEPELRRDRAGRARVTLGAPARWSASRPPRPTSGPGFDVLAAALALSPRARGGARRRRSRSSPTSTSRATAATWSCARSSGCTRRTGSSSGSRSEIPLCGGLGSSAAAIVAGLLAADHMFGLDADVPALAAEIEGHPDNVAAALHGGFVVCDGGRVARLAGADGARGGAGRARTRRSAPKRRGRRCRATVPLADAVFNVAHAATAGARPRARATGS